MAIRFLKFTSVCMLAGLAGCTVRRTEVHREWYEQISLDHGLVIRHGDSSTPAMEFLGSFFIAERQLQALADTTEEWNLDTAGIRMEIPSVHATAPFSFTIRSPRIPAIGDSLRFQIAGGAGSDPNPPKVKIHRLEKVAGAPMLVDLQPENLSLDLVGIPFDPTFAPVLPPQSRILARKAVRFRISFDDRILEGETSIVEYRYAATTIDEEREGL